VTLAVDRLPDLGEPIRRDELVHLVADESLDATGDGAGQTLDAFGGSLG
jgi:hypothetical protein